LPTSTAAQPSAVSKGDTDESQIDGANQTKPGKRKNLDHHNIIPSSIDKENFKFNTKAFMIRYCEEEVELNDIIHFRLEIDTDQHQSDNKGEGKSNGNFNQTEMVMEVELMFSDLLNHGGPEKFSIQNSLKDIEEKVEFKSVAF
jgi:hypothetical protein